MSLFPNTSAASPKYLRAFSACSGIGGFELGFRQARVPVHWIGHAEINKFPLRIYRTHFSHPNYGDLHTLIPKDIPDFDLLTGGFPCQSFSDLGRKGGLADPRGQVFFALVRLLAAKRPRFLLLENVKGLVGHHRGKTLWTALHALTDLGYGLEWQVLDSAHFGAPQHRERFFLSGTLGGRPARPLFPLRPRQRPTLNSARHAVPVRSVRQRRLRGQVRRFWPAGSPTPTLTCTDRLGVVVGKRIRQLTPRECERLQGFPEDWTRFGLHEDGRQVVMSDLQRYAALGNAVTVPVVMEIARKWNTCRKAGIVKTPIPTQLSPELKTTTR